MSVTIYSPKPIPSEGIELTDELVSLRETLAEHLHDVWALGRMKQGWTYGAKRDDDAMTHPCLVPYTDLPEDEKEFDRASAIGTLKAILASGFQITR